MRESDGDARTLRRSIGTVAATAIVVNAVLGTGIFLKMPDVLCNAGSPARALGVWIAAGLLALAGAAIYAELGAMHPQAGGEYVFLREAFGPFWGFLYGWMRYLLGNAGGQAALVLAFATFLDLLTNGAFEREFFRLDLFGLDYAFGTRQLVALAVLGGATAVNCLPAATNGRISIALASFKVALAIAVGAAAFLLSDGDWSHLARPLEAGDCAAASTDGGIGSAFGAAGMGAALVGALWAYNGWYALTLLGEEVRDPGRSLPRALLAGMTIVVVTSTIVSIGYLYALAPSEIAAGDGFAVGSAAVLRVLGPTGLAVVLSALLASTFGALQIALMGNARVGYAMARDGLFLEKSVRLSASGVPIRSLLTQAQWTSVLVISSSLDTLTDAMIFASWLFYGLAALALIRLRRLRPEAERPYRVWGYPVVPAIFIAAAAVIVADTMLLAPARSIGALALIALGVVAYRYFSRRERAASPRDAT